jgi:restriction system protein
VFAYLRKIEPFVFEELLLTCFERQGYKIVRNTRYTGDGGIDGKVYIDGRLYLIQAKRYSGSIKLAHLQDFATTIKSNRGVGGYFIHTGITGTGCRDYLDQHPYIQLISGQRLIEFIKLSK